MAIDLTSGMDASSDHFLAERPEDPQFRESASMWISDDQGVIGLPRVGIEALADTWDKRDLQVNLGFPDGRSVVVRESGVGRSPVDDDGICRTFAAGGLEFRHVEPFRTLTMTYDGTGLDTTALALARGELDAPRVPLQIEVELTCAAPPWIPGTLSEEAAALFHEGFAGAFISPRYEQLCTSRGTVRVGGDEWSFTGTGLRIHRQGPRDVGGFWGHCWPSALFPSGKGFGGLAFPERPDGEPTYNEAYVFDGERMIPATLVDAPWLRRLQPFGEDVAVTLRTTDGDVRIEGETIVSACMAGGTHHEFAPALQQAGVRYRWDGEESYGMMERSIPVAQLEDPRDERRPGRGQLHPQPTRPVRRRPGVRHRGRDAVDHGHPARGTDVDHERPRVDHRRGR